MLVWGPLVAAILTLACLLQLCLRHIIFWNYLSRKHPVSYTITLLLYELTTKHRCFTDI